MDREDFPAEFGRMLELSNSSQMLEFWRRVQAVAGSPLGGEHSKPFLYAHNWVNQRPESPGLTRLRPKAVGKPDWRNVLIDAVLANVQQAVAGCHYRRNRLCELDTTIQQIAVETGVSRLVAQTQGTIAGGDLIALHCEYQDFLILVRRCLDYLARAVGAYFKRESWSFRDLKDALPEWKPQEVAQRIHKELMMREDAFMQFLSEGINKTTRDRIVHLEFVPAGYLNVTPWGVYLAGGGEELALSERLMTRIDKYLTDLQSIIWAVLSSLVDADRGYHEAIPADEYHNFDPKSPIDEKLRRQMLERTRRVWGGDPIVSRTRENRSRLECMICGWTSSAEWTMSEGELSAPYKAAEREACQHMADHRKEMRAQLSGAN